MKLKALFSFAVLAAILSGCGGSGDSSTELVYGVSATGNLVKFKLSSPGTIISSVPITGLQGGEDIVGIDFRDADGLLYAVGDTSRLYTVNLTTGVATLVGAQFTTLLTGTTWGVDFNQVADRIRIVGDSEDSMRINPNNAAVAGVDTDLNPAGNVVACAYTPPASGLTTLYAVDSVTDQLELIGSINGTPTSPNSGVVTVVGNLGIDINNSTSLDIDSSTGAVLYSTVAGVSGVYSVNLNTGAATFIGQVGSNLALTAIALKD